MVDVRQAPVVEDAGVALPWWWPRLTIAYVIVMAIVMNMAFQGARQDAAHRIDSLVKAGILTYEGHLAPQVIATRRSDALVNQACWDSHPKPADQPEPWYPPDCGVYLLRDLDADVEAAHWAVAHPNGSIAAGWAATLDPLWQWSLGYVVLTGVAIGASAFPRRFGRRRTA